MRSDALFNVSRNTNVIHIRVYVLALANINVCTLYTFVLRSIAGHFRHYPTSLR